MLPLPLWQRVAEEVVLEVVVPVVEAFNSVEVEVTNRVAEDAGEAEGAHQL